MKTLSIETFETLKGYRLSYLKENLTQEEYDSLLEFLYGQTVAFIDGEEVVYPSDFDRWNNRR